ncbi:head-tail adaptor [Microbacterium phage Hendrix]|uniref:Head-to-tail adaptor n=1 Tax=Microbacterium phage Hendrix TaxID=2182341 RepID=A0A2U8UU85_9CAUD|nr:head-tail adaptor [Microbacterium phage Hendrix]AWN07734.1 hypothetical protein PBI_HENDRIX_63 [Microbacterium phage Hendrix]
MLELCDWPIDYAGCGATPGDPTANPPKPPSTGVALLDDMTPEQRAIWERMASEFLWNWTNRVFGTCPVALRPCTSNCGSWEKYRSSFWGRGPFPWQGSWDGGSWVPVLIGGQWYNMTCGCVSSCKCSIEGPASLALPGPVATVLQVKVDGVTLPSSSYRVMYKRFLVRTDGGVWPACQDLLADPDQPPSDTNGSSFEVIYNRGIEVPIGGQLAAGMLAAEFAKAGCNDRSCQLPRRIKTIVRQEVTVDLMDSFDSIKEGGTGIWIIDSWVQSVVAPRPFASVRSVDVKPKVSTHGW